MSRSQKTTGVTHGDVLRAELDGTADRGRGVTDEELDEWLGAKEAAAHRRSELAAESPDELGA